MAKKQINYIGGQAVIEGVMMRGKKMYCVAVRNINTNEITVKKEKFKSTKKNVFLRLPIIRGIVAFVSSMILGFKILILSANLAGLEDETEKKTKFDIWLENKFGEKLTEYIMYFSIFLSIIFSVVIFMGVPALIGGLIGKYINLTSFKLSLIEGIIRILIFLVYIIIMAKLKDVNRLFKYHGAEHKTINCFEKKIPLTIENVKAQTRLHKRCGTSFLIIIMIVSILVFMFVKTDNIYLRVFSRIILAPILAGISYEIIKIAGKYDNILVKIISAPGMALQRITTREPDESMIETAILSLKGVLEDEQDDKNLDE